MGRKKITQQEVESHCMEHDYKVLSPYVDNHTKIKLQNIKTGNIGEMRFSNFKKGKRFDNSKAKTKLTQQEVEEYCESQGYRVLSKYVNSNTKITLQNVETGEIGKVLFSNFKKGSRFDNPKYLKKLTYKEYIRPLIDESYTVLIDEKEYKNVNTGIKIDVLCPNNHQWSVKRNHFTSHNQRCPMCNQSIFGGMSVGEKMVYQLLQGNDIAFEREKSVYIDGNRYRFDFYFEVEEFGNIDRFFVEYDGEQHYHDVSGYFSEGLKKRRASDEIKDKYAHENNIQMIRIPWLNNTIDKILFVINGETGLGLHSVDVVLPTIQEISDYYSTHSGRETANKFNIGHGAVDYYFKQIYGTTKRKYLGASKKQVVDYYLSHSVKETSDEFNISYTTVNKYFQQAYGTNKQVYLRTNKQEYRGTNKQEISDYYLSHNVEETMGKFNIGRATTVNRYFKQIHGMSKTEYLGTSIQEIAGYYLSHNKKETMNKFRIGNAAIIKYFKQIYGVTKTEYLKLTH